MDESDPDLLPEGLEDRLPGEAATGQQVMRAMLAAMDGHGYDRVSPPLIEFERSLAGRMSGISTRRMFRFVDPASLRTLALRSDITPQVGRIAETRLANAPRPLRLCYAGPVVTIRGDGLDPARERLQVGAELIGRDTVAAAAEVAGLAIEALAAAGATGISIDFTLPDLVDTLAVEAMRLAPSSVAAVRRQLDAKDAGALVAAGGEAYLPLLYAAGPFASAIDKLAAIDAGGALASRIAGLREIAARLDGAARVTLDPTERHGFEYQSWVGFTLFAEGVRGSLGRGGTYRIGREDGEGEVATGFSLYPDGLVGVVAGEAARNALFLPLDHDREAAARLRAIGWRTVAALDAKDDGATLGCSHRLENGEPKAL
ncbi:ATP phosphoribosyltransferase regulatory subunit [Novosphingobium sp. Gsoil 351]|uniref:ATP phosphoribosyltransferase regulatory subunit n=1 Tax=Novosphingobium sp. Gsoil 351 TaxID=2675225 RepID=UPI0012B4D7DE|nr:ATP phosphoribosyltransferase regulatory subunit [Novosphingobium sp. Gsoil 351]QGN53196.1 ATP phosphoribosyltransferase regulatory subunit [Novosphingobium sp. Gsoil 351]QGN56199.1 ATP phosphoribosyltransferase regulatory subunit [Novosphingobium sp. Gsoil 351]